ncbi:MAG: hypothetical protein K2L13_00985, partial [Opitutales bacterium]|nr:hypothetical protein [Opitutales bacterium]
MSGNNVFNIGTNNLFTSSSSSSKSASVVIGTASGYNNSSTVSGNNVFDIGTNNLFTSSSYSSSSISASTVIGAASGYSSDSTVSGNNVFDIGTNNLFTSSSYSSYYSASTVIGAASGNASTAKGMSINMNGSQMVGALSNSKVNAFGADNTDAEENKAGWRIGLYNSETNNAATVNILAAKGSTAFSDDQATVTLAASQGSSRTTYARAFALGSDYQIYIGGQGEVTRDSSGRLQSIGTELKGFGTSTGNVVNIFGAIAPAKNAENLTDNRCANSSLTIDKSWTTNAYGSLEGLENVKVLGEGKLRTFGKVSNIGTLTVGDSTTSGEVVVYKEATLGTTVLGNGVLKAGACTDNGATTALNNMTKGKTSLPLKFTNPEDNAKVCDVTSITSTDYVNNFGTVGTLTLNGEVTFKVDTSKVDANVGTKVGDQMTNQFQLVKGYITLDKVVDGENTTCGKLELGTGGKFTIADESTSTIDPENRALMFVRASGLTVEQMLGTQFMRKFTAVNTGLYALNSGANLLTNTGLIVGKVNIYAKDGIGIGLMNEEYARSVNTVDGGASTPGAIVKGPLNIIIQTPETEGHTWALYGDAAGGSNDISTNKVTFKDEGSTKGSISVSNVAANIKFDDDVLAADNVTDLKKKSLLTIDFQNEPSIDVPEIDATKKAHVYAKNTNGSVTALQLSDNVNL